MLKNLKRLIYIFMMVLFFSMALNANVFATSWVEMEPEEVIDKAEVIALGTYDFSSKAIPGDYVFQGFTFNVKRIYHGEVDAQITAGIDMYDAGWVDEFQNEGGEFLLFLEKDKDDNFLIPVGGPNGMIQIKNGEVVEHTGVKKDFHEEILHGESKEPSIKNSKSPEKGGEPSITLFASLGALIGGIGGFLIYRRLRKG